MALKSSRCSYEARCSQHGLFSLVLLAAIVFGVGILKVDGITGPHHMGPYLTDSTAEFSKSISTPGRILSHITGDQDALPPLLPLRLKDYVGFSFAIFGLMLAAGGGLGGGGILVPTYILILDFPVKRAIPLASVTVLGGAIANNILNWSRRHPNYSERPCIDWDLILQMEPMTIAGAMVGAHLNVLLSGVVLVILLFIVLTLTAYETLAKACVLYGKETQALMCSETMTLIEGKESSSKPQYGTAIAEGNAEDERGCKHYNGPPIWVQALKLTSLFVVVTLINLLKGGLEGGPQQNGLNQWIPDLTIFIIILLFSIFMRWEMLTRLRSGSGFHSEIAWDDQNTLFYPTVSVFAGLVAGMFGVGGGIVKAPLMIALGVHPVVASATAACMILFTSSTATISYAVFGFLVYDYAIVCLLVGFLATLAGQTIMSAVIKRYKRNSYIAFSIGFVVAISAVCMTIESIVALKAT